MVDGQAGSCMDGGGGGDVDDVWWGWKKSLGRLCGLVRLDLGYGEGLDGDGEEVIGVVLGCEIY